MTGPTSVLLVDDIPEYLDTMEINLPAGCRGLRAASLDEAKALCTESQPTVAVIDIRLNEDDPENRDGLDLLTWMQQHHPNTVVIMISAYRDFEKGVDALTMGAEFFLKKPIQPDEFRDTVSESLGLAIPAGSRSIP